VYLSDEQQRVVESADTPTIEQSLARVQASFKVQAVDSDDDGEEELMTTVTRLSLKCPLGLCAIETPARGKACQHLQASRGVGGKFVYVRLTDLTPSPACPVRTQCFDLATFLRFCEKCTSAAWNCGVCHNPLAVEDIQVSAESSSGALL
jgi:SUMO ligase MMS21 Smc5/6 complex component